MPIRMDNVLLISNIVLVLFTGIYVFLTYRLMKESAKNNNNNVDFYREQLRLSCMPIIAVNIPDHINNRNIYVNIENIGTLPAFEVDIWLVSTVHNDDYPKSKLSRLAKDKENKLRLRLINKDNFADGMYYGLIDHGFYSVFHGNYMIKLNFCL